jgi:UDP-glucose 4-epimerase
MLKIAITGSSGFLAGHIMKQLIRSGHQVIPVTRQHLDGAVQVQDYRHTPSADLLIHLAEEPDRQKVNKIGRKYIEYSSNIAAILTEKFDGNVIYASSGTVYGDKEEAPYTINSPIYATDIYSESKITNERIVLESGGTVLRLSNVYGKGMSSNNVMSDIIKQLQGNNGIVVNDVSPIRDFILVTDVAKLLSIIVRTGSKGVVNVGSGASVSIYHLIKTFLKIIERKDKKIISRIKSSKASINVLDISDTQSKFDWSPSTDLEANLQLVLAANKGNI